jgi:hypothetical protein
MMQLEIKTGMAYSSAQVLITPKAKAEQPAPVRRGFFTSIVFSMVGRARNTTPARGITPPTLAGYQRPTTHTPVAGQLLDKEPKTMQVQTNGAAAPQFNQLDRDTAFKYNGFIGINPAETIERVSEAVFDLGYLCSLSAQHDMPLRPAAIYRFTNILCAALEYEQAKLKEMQS